MHDDEVPLEATARGRQIAPAIAVPEPVAVGDRALMLHAEMRRLDQLEAVLVERIGSEPVLEARHHRNGLLELDASRVEVDRERIEIQRERSLLALIHL